jgi:hypothetical protein
VEGCDFGTAIYPMHYPFTDADFDARIQAIETEATALWKWSNEIDDNEQSAAELGIDPPDFYFEFSHLSPEGRSA